MAISRPDIPPRNLSKKAQVDQIADLELTQQELETAVEKKENAIKLKGSIGDLHCWTQLLDAQDATVNLHGVKRKISQLELVMNGDDEEEDTIREWAQTSVGKRHLENEAAVKGTAALLKQQKDRVSSTKTDLELSKGRTWMSMFLSSQMGLNTTIGGRYNSLQTMFRKELEGRLGGI